MPKCYVCKKDTHPYKLKEVRENNRGWPVGELCCADCRRKKLTRLVSKTEMTEEKMTSKERKPIASIQITNSIVGEDNYDISGYVRLGGMKLEIDTDLDQIRGFFTKRRNAKEAVKDLSTSN